ncbi:hypothetical protein T492DRAFT_962414 [Pavlovales sp. CCMP2436]|nr:hypothetical protein T492DRAFT_962414 [Pavlovales sp. CCMP2436]
MLRAAIPLLFLFFVPAASAVTNPKPLQTRTSSARPAPLVPARPLLESNVLESTGFPQPYWFDERIHNLGNVGLVGGLHAAIAPIITHVIDRLAYKNVDARRQVHKTISAKLDVVDLACGVGFSSVKGATGVDTSKEMLGIARLRRPDVTFVEGNAETYGADASHDVCTIMFATHEMPRDGRQRVLANAMRVARKYVLVVDICPSFRPTEVMLTGEPYVLDYLEHIDADVRLAAANRAWRTSKWHIVKGHVVMWRLDL